MEPKKDKFVWKVLGVFTPGSLIAFLLIVTLLLKTDFVNFKPAVFLIQVSICIFFGALVELGDRFRRMKVFYWMLAIIAVAFTPPLIELIHEFDYDYGFCRNFATKVFSMFCNYGFFGILFSFLTAGYIDYCYSTKRKRKFIHYLTALLFVLLVATTFIPGSCMTWDELNETLKFTTNSIRLIVQLEFYIVLVVYMTYLKGISD